MSVRTAAKKALVSTKWLASALASNSGASTIALVDASWHMPNSGRNPREEHAVRRIAGASFFDLDAVSDTSSDMPHMLPTAARFSEAMLGLGATSESHIIAYDASDFGVFSSARLWWMCKVFGHSNVSVLDGGLQKWAAESRDVVTDGSSSVTIGTGTDLAGKFDATEPSTSLLKTHDEIRALVDGGRLGSPGFELQVLDARPANRFSGEVPEPRPQLSSGHMPGSMSVPFGSLLNADTKTLLPPSQLAAVFENAGVDVNAGVVTSCGSGVTACVVTLALEVLAEEGVGVGASRHVYDGSWTQYASDPAAQIVKSC